MGGQFPEGKSLSKKTSRSQVAYAIDAAARRVYKSRDERGEFRDAVFVVESGLRF